MPTTVKLFPILKASHYTLISLLAPACFGVFWFGTPALVRILVAVSTCVVIAKACDHLQGYKQRNVLSPIITGLLLSLTLRWDTPILLIVCGAISAEVIGRHYIKFLGRNLLNPAVTGRCVIALMETALPFAKGANQEAWDFVSGATVLFVGEGGYFKPSLFQALIGTVNGAIGETSTLVLIVCAAFMLKKVILKFEGPVIMLLSVPIFVAILPAHISVIGHSPWIHNPLLFCAGSSFILTAIYFLGDPVTTPKTRRGQMAAGLIIGFACVVGKLVLAIDAFEMWILLLVNCGAEFLDKVLGSNSAVSPDTKVIGSQTYTPVPTTLCAQTLEKMNLKAFKTLESLDLERNRAVIKQKLYHMPLGGRGGSHFSAWNKWALLESRPLGRVLIVNIMEGETGTFKDSLILRNFPELAAEGILICAALLQITEIHLAGESRNAPFLQRLYHIIDSKMNLVSTQGREYSARLHVFEKAPYIAGEETALISLLEGNGPLPRQKPPTPMESGLFSRPTLVHNLETLVWLPVILAEPEAWGRGKLLISLCGATNRPGVYEVELGTPLSKFLAGVSHLNDLQVTTLQLGGGSGVYLPINTTLLLDSDSLREQGAILGTGSLRLIRHHDCLLEDLLQNLRFLQDASCGQCTPCSLGTKNQFQLISALAHGKLTRREFQSIKRLHTLMQSTSICGLGKTAHGPLNSIIKNFPEEIDYHLEGHHIRDCIRMRHAHHRKSKSNSLPWTPKSSDSVAAS